MRAVISILVLVVFAAAAAFAWYLFVPNGQADVATATADAFVTAWSEEDWAAMDDLVTEPRAAGAHAEAVEGLEASGVAVTLTNLDLEQVDEGVAPARYEAVYDLDGLGTWRHEGEFEVVEVAGEWAVDWQPSVLHPDFEVGLQFLRTRFWPQRAAITGPGGVDLVGEGDVVIVGIEPGRVQDDDEVVEAIEELTPAPGLAAAAILERGDLRDDWFYPVVSMSRPAYDAVRPVLRPVPGLVFQEQTGRTGSSAAVEELIGRVDEITAEQLDQLGDHYRVGDQVGRTGLEASLEQRLAGEPGGEIVLVDRDGEEVASLHEFPAREPEPVELTLDVAVQDAAAQALEDVEVGALVAVDIESGALRAAVSRPGEGFARAFTGQYAPGSTFKVVTAAALLEAGLASTGEVDCPGEITAGGRSFRNAGDAALGRVPFSEAFAESCNTAFIGAAAELGEGALGEMAARFGFGQGDEGAYTVAGRRVRSSFPEPGDAAEAAAAAIGQGRVSAGPIQMASVVATAASGTMRRPYLLAEEAAEGQEALPGEVSATLRELLRLAVADGTGSAADVGDVAGKTGTAQHDGGEDHAWFIGTSGSLAFAVLVEAGGAGGQAAAPVAADFVRALGR